MKTVFLVGTPNVGKSVLFYLLTGNYVTVSNYPGTTVEITQGIANINGNLFRIFDTPGMYSLSPVTEEEAVTRRLLLELSPDLIIHVADAKNLVRMLPLTLELLSLNVPLILVLNMMDEAERLGVRVNCTQLGQRLGGVQVVPAAFVQGRGLAQLKRAILLTAGKKQPPTAGYVPKVALQLASRLKGDYPFPTPVMARLILENDQEVLRLVAREETGANLPKLLCFTAEEGRKRALDFALERRQAAERILFGIFQEGDTKKQAGWLDNLILDPYFGFLIMIIVLYAGLYLVVGRFGAGYLVDLLDGALFGKVINPAVNSWVKRHIPWMPLVKLLALEHGLLTLGLRYAFGVILPIVGTFFFVFSLLEDSGYLPRLAFLADGLMKRLGLNGRAIIPLVLGLGCGTMAVLVTRTLESKRERVISTFLLALAVPCSAQLGLIMAILTAEPVYLFIWLVVLGSLLVSVGYILDALLPGSRPPFFLEFPPLRTPRLNAIFQKTLARMRWYFLEIIPVFAMVSVVLWLLEESGWLATLSGALAPLLGWMGLPPPFALVFIFGFFRRDYGAAGLYDLYRHGAVSSAQLLVASVVLTLFLPCLAQLAVMIRERGPAVAIITTVLVFLVALAVGIVLRAVLGLPLL